MYQAFNRESGHLPREQLGHFGLIDPETRGCLHLLPRVAPNRVLQGLE